MAAGYQVTLYSYNSAGEQDGVADPDSDITATIDDALGRTVATISGYHNPGSSTLAQQLASIAQINPNLSNITAIAPPSGMPT